MDDIQQHPIELVENGVYEVDECVMTNVLDEGHNVALPTLRIGGSLERETGIVWLFLMPDRGAASPIPRIQAFIPAGSFIRTDDHIVYHRLVHINGLEGVFCQVRARLRNRSGGHWHVLNLS